MDRMDRIFSGDGGLAVLDIRKSAQLHRRSPPLIQQPTLLIILCILYILCIDVQSRFLLGRRRRGGVTANLMGLSPVSGSNPILENPEARSIRMSWSRYVAHGDLFVSTGAGGSGRDLLQPVGIWKTRTRQL